MKKIFLHIGLHKTGTTALQSAFLRCRENLKEQGFYYPRVGIPLNSQGHHNIAWGFLRDRRYMASSGDIHALLNEIESVDCPNTIISSEDFESLLNQPMMLEKVTDVFSKNGFKVLVIIYFRNQADYLISLYGELLKAGLGIEFKLLFERFMMEKYFYYNEWKFSIDYLKIKNSLSQLKGVDIIYRNYDQLINDDVLEDFCTVIRLDFNYVDNLLDKKIINKRLHLDTLLRLFVGNRFGKLSDSAISLIDEICYGLSSDFVYSRQSFDRINNFVENNSVFADTNNYTKEYSSGVCIERFFSLETCTVLLSLIKLKQDSVVRNKIIHDWRAWVTLSAPLVPLSDAR
jgi:hypothetical protein